MPPIDAQPTETEQAAITEAERRARPFVILRDGDGVLRIVTLDARRVYTIGRRPEADLALPWDREVSRLHAELRRLAGEWTISDDGLSQNGTYVNETRLVGRRRLADGDLVRVGRTRFTFRDPRAASGGLTLLPGEVGAATSFSQQQHDVLRELCRPLAQDGEGIKPASNEVIALALDIPEEHVAGEMLALYGAFGVEDLPDAEARRDVASAALGSGLVSFEDLT